MTIVSGGDEKRRRWRVAVAKSGVIVDQSKFAVFQLTSPVQLTHYNNMLSEQLTSPAAAGAATTLEIKVQ